MPEDDFFTLTAEGKFSCVCWSASQPLDKSKIKATTNRLLLFIEVQMILDAVYFRIVKPLPIVDTTRCQGAVTGAEAKLIISVSIT
jgi:hypothetical protein